MIDTMSQDTGHQNIAQKKTDKSCTENSVTQVASVH